MGTSLITPDPGTILWTIITFVILAALLAKFAWKPLLATLDERERTVREALEQAQKARADSEETLRRNQEILAGARRETAAILEQGKREGESLRAEILAQARKEAQELVEQGKRQVLYEQKQAMEQVRRQVGDLALQVAERLVTGVLDDPKHRELVDEYVAQLPTSRSEDRQR